MQTVAKSAERWAIIFGSQTPKIANFTLKSSFYCNFSIIFEISTPEIGGLKKKFLLPQSIRGTDQKAFMHEAKISHA